MVLIAVELLYNAVCFALSNSFDKRGIWPPAALFLTFTIAKSFFGALYNISIVIGLS